MFQAISEYNKAKPVNMHEIGECYRLLADKYMQTERFAEAQRYYEKALALADQLPADEVFQAKESLADCLFHLKEYSKEKDLLEGLIAEVKTNPLKAQQFVALQKKLSECQTTMIIQKF